MRKLVGVAVCAAVVLCSVASRAAETFNVVIMASQDPKKEGPKYEALSQYLKAAIPALGDIQLRVAKNYPEAAQLFKAGEADGMFAGSFVAAVFIRKDLAKPVARPLGTNGVSTYKAVIVAKEGTKPFAGIQDFRGKRVAYSALASSGEVFVRTMLAAGEKPDAIYTPVVAPSHQAALNAVKAGEADYAVVKNTIFKPADYPGLAAVGADSEENPDNTLILTNAAYAKYGAEVSRALLAMEADNGEKADAVKKAFGAKSFIPTAAKDFEHTFSILEKAHIDAKKFDFAF